VSRGLARAIRERAAILARDPEAAKLYLPDGKPLQAGALLVQADLARTLEAIARGARLSDEPFASSIEKATRGCVTRADLEGYRPLRRPPVRGTYHDQGVVSFPPPSSGGVHLVEMLNVLEALDAT